MFYSKIPLIIDLPDLRQFFYTNITDVLVSHEYTCISVCLMLKSIYCAQQTINFGCSELGNRILFYSEHIFAGVLFKISVSTSIYMCGCLMRIPVIAGAFLMQIESEFTVLGPFVFTGHFTNKQHFRHASALSCRKCLFHAY